MKTKNAFLVLLMLCTWIGKAEKIKGNGNLVTKDIKVSEYEEIQLGGNIEYPNSWGVGKNSSPVSFSYTQGGSATLQITMDENLFSSLKIESSDGKLSIRTHNNTHLSPTKLLIKGSSKNLKKLETSGCMDFFAKSALSGDQLAVKVSGSCDIVMEQSVRYSTCELSVSGSGDITIDKLSCQMLKSNVSGSGDIQLKGNAEKGEFSVSGSGDLSTYGMQVKHLDCSVSGSGDAEVYATEKLNASVSGSGELSYKGTASVNKSVTGSGEIHKAN